MQCMGEAEKIEIKKGRRKKIRGRKGRTRKAMTIAVSDDCPIVIIWQTETHHWVDFLDEILRSLATFCVI